jgi:ketosteroid isomerase-like protein
MSEELVEKVRRSFDAWNRGDVDGWLEAAHPEVEWTSEIVRRMEGADAVYRGVDELRAYWDDSHALWDVHVELTEILDRGETLVALGTVRARGEASGVDLEGPIAYVFEFTDGLVRKVRAYLDPQEALLWPTDSTT